MMPFANFEQPANRKTLMLGPKKTLADIEKMRHYSNMNVPNVMRSQVYFLPEKERAILQRQR